ncbi:MAG: hypothetical protein LR017_00160 [Candidatus Pacebacteria bacterium]|nr:hypothetical protein [Candidatus Paceibacterota bacterium]
MSTAQTVKTLQAVAMLVGIALLLWSTGLPAFLNTVEAASITNASDTLTVSAPSAAANHTITFTTPNGMIANATFEVTFDGSFTMGSVGEDDVDILVADSSSSTAASNGAAT